MNDLVEIIANLYRPWDRTLFKLKHKNNIFLIPWSDVDDWSSDCHHCQEVYYITLARKLLDNGCITKRVYYDIDEYCPKCVIDYLIRPVEKQRILWHLWKNEVSYIYWIPEEVLKDIFNYFFDEPKQFEPIGTFEERFHIP
jgi:hypothetical protein